jgi:hypothetical protein
VLCFDGEVASVGCSSAVEVRVNRLRGEWGSVVEGVQEEGEADKEWWEQNVEPGDAEGQQGSYDERLSGVHPAASSDVLKLLGVETFRSLWRIAPDTATLNESR